MNPNDNIQMEEESLDIKKYIFLILSNWYWFALSVFVCLFIAYLLNRYSDKIYRIQSSLIVRDDESPNSYTGAENLIQGLKLVRNTKSVQNEIGILKSYSLASKAISELDEFKVTYMGVGRRGIVESELYINSPYKVEVDSLDNNLLGYPINVTILSKDKYLLEIDNQFDIKKEMLWGEKFKSEQFNFKLVIRSNKFFNNYTKGAKTYFLFNDLNALSNIYRSKIVVELNDKKGSILNLTTTGTVARKEADYQNKLMQVYIQKGLDEKNRIAENTIRFIDTQLSDMTDSLRNAERRLQDFRSTNKVINIDKEGVLIYDNVKQLQDEKAKTELRSRYYQYLRKYLDDKKNLSQIVAPSAIGIEDPQLSELLGEISSIFVEKEELKLSVSSYNPGLSAIEFRLSTLIKTLDEKVNSLIDLNKVTKSEIDRRMLTLDKEMSAIPYNERLLIGFEREFNLINKMYNYLNEKRAEAAIARASNIADNKILDLALPENAMLISPNKKMVFITGLMLGILIPLAVIMISSFLNTAITDIKDISRYTKAPILGLIGHNVLDTETPVVLNPKSTMAESFRGLRTNLGYILREPNRKVIMVTSTVSGEGKTFIAVNLALIMSITGKKVLLVGMDLRKPKLNSIISTAGQAGLSTFLIGKNNYDEVIFSTKYENLSITPSGPIPPNPAELLGLERMDEFINQAKQQFDFIIIDTPPVAIVTDTIVASRFSDAIIYITRFNYTNKEAVSLVENLKTKNGESNIAVIVNDVAQKQRYGYSYGYGFAYGSHYYYYRDSDYYTDEEKSQNLKNKVLRFFS